MEQASLGAERRELSFDRAADGTLRIRLGGSWRIQQGLESTASLEREIRCGPKPTRIAYDTGDLLEWDSSVLTFLVKVRDLCEREGITTDLAGLPGGVRRLLELSRAAPEGERARVVSGTKSSLARVGEAAIAAADSMVEQLGFLGEVALASANLLRGRARFRRQDLLLVLQQTGAEAVPIIGLIGFLVGLILAFVGAVQLRQFGAAIFVADLVGIGMVREMGAMMAAIVMAGRTGAAFAAQLGTMKVTQEIDALTTMGLSPVEFLVLPRMTALFLMMPFLCLYADFVGIMGGAAVGVGMLDISLNSYIAETASAVDPSDLFGGIFKSAVYGLLIAICGCASGMRCRGSAAAVGEATTRAVVSGIVAVIAACGVFAVVFFILGI